MQPDQAANTTKLPRAVLRRSAAIDARYAPKPPETDIPPAADAAPAPAPATDPATVVEPPASAPTVDPREHDPAYWKQRFTVTSGILAHKRDEYETGMRNLNRQLTEAQEKLRLSQAKTPAPAVKVDLAKFFTDEQIEKYGAEQCETMAAAATAAAHETAQGLIEAAVQPFKEDREQRIEQEATRRKQEFDDKLSEQVPNWRTLDVDPRWREWLSEDDEHGVQRQSILDIHIGNRNAVQVGRMFRNWEKTVAPPAIPAPPAPPLPKPTITPNGSGAAAEAAPPVNANAVAKGAPSGADVKDYFKRSALGKVKAEERIEFEARLALRHPPR